MRRVALRGALLAVRVGARACTQPCWACARQAGHMLRCVAWVDGGSALHGGGHPLLRWSCCHPSAPAQCPAASSGALCSVRTPPVGPALRREPLSVCVCAGCGCAARCGAAQWAPAAARAQGHHAHTGGERQEHKGQHGSLGEAAPHGPNQGPWQTRAGKGVCRVGGRGAGGARVWKRSSPPCDGEPVQLFTWSKLLEATSTLVCASAEGRVTCRRGHEGRAACSARLPAL